MEYLHKGMFGTPDEERARFRKTAEEWMKAGKPVRLHLGFGQHPLPDFLNLDRRFCVRENRVSAQFHENCFLFDWPMGLPLPDDTVDFIFHEDMYEHLTQQQQFELLAETLRVLQPGRFHRINCPNIAYIMRAASDFSKGRAGVYDEWTRWSHVNVPTRASLEEQAKIVGYEKVHFNGKNQTVSGVWFRERRPGGQYDQNAYNIFADLEKPAKVDAAAGAPRAMPAWTDPATEAIIPGDEQALELARLVDSGDTDSAWKLYEAEQEAVEQSTRDLVHVAAMQLGLAVGKPDVALRHALKVNAKDRYLARNRPEWAYEVAKVLDSAPEHREEADSVRARLEEVGDRFPQTYSRLVGKVAQADEAGANALVERLLARPGNSPEVAARLLLLSARPDEAVPHLERLREGDPANEWASVTLADSLRKLGRAAEARSVVADFLERSPGHANALVMKARLEWKLGQRSEAAATARQAIEAGTDDGPARRVLEDILAKA